MISQPNWLGQNLNIGVFLATVKATALTLFMMIASFALFSSVPILMTLTLFQGLSNTRKVRLEVSFNLRWGANPVVFKQDYALNASWTLTFSQGVINDVFGVLPDIVKKTEWLCFSSRLLRETFDTLPEDNLHYLVIPISMMYFQDH